MLESTEVLLTRTRCDRKTQKKKKEENKKKKDSVNIQVKQPVLLGKVAHRQQICCGISVLPLCHVN